MRGHEFGPRGQLFPGGKHMAAWLWLRPVAAMIILAGLVVLVAWLIMRMKRSMDRRPVTVQRGDHALEELRMRYARGELSREDFHRIGDDLRGAPAAT